MTVNIIVQARMVSTRLPGKVMMEVLGKPMIGYLFERLAKCTLAAKVIYALPSYSGGSIGRYLDGRDAHVVTYYGDEEDVAGRFDLALTRHPCDAFARVCADSPLIDPAVVDEAIELWETRRPAVVSNTRPPTMPHGQLVEVVRTNWFRGRLLLMDKYDREHVTPRCYDNPVDWIRFGLEPSVIGPSLVLDTQQDFDKIKAVIEAMAATGRDHTEFGWRELCALAS